MYFIKWLGYSKEESTWEYKSHLNCPVILARYGSRVYYEEKKLKKQKPLDKQKKVTLSPSVGLLSVDEYSTLAESSVNGFSHPFNKSTVNHLEQPYALRARDYQQELREWNAALNAKCKGKEAPILVENKYDQFLIPKDFEYVCTNLYGKDVPNPADHEPVTYCKCQKCGIGSNGCCPTQLEALFPYYSNGRIRVAPGKPIYECNSACVCGPECCNRVVQKLRSIPLCIFRTGDAKGWGVKAVKEIKKTSFVCEYTGEVIMFDEAEQRGAVANAMGLTYIFDLDFHSEDDGRYFSIDASKYGNISHFFNHSVSQYTLKQIYYSIIYFLCSVTQT